MDGRRTFVSTSKGGLDLVDYASQAQLRSFVRVFGLYGARAVGCRAGDALGRAMAGLESVLLACEPVLRGLNEALQVALWRSSYCPMAFRV